MWRCRFDTPGKLIPAHSAGAHTARGLCVAPGRWVGAELTAAGPPTAQGYPWEVCGPPHQITWPPSRTATQNLAQTRKGKKTAGKDFEIFRESA